MEKNQVEAVRLAEPVRIDGRLDEPVWATAKPYPLMVPGGRPQLPVESASVRWAWDHEALYIAFAADDRDIVAEAEEDGMPHFQHGDTLEVFIGPIEQTWYWEFHATPAGKRNTLFLPGAGRRDLLSTRGHDSRFEVGQQVEGTLNEWRDTDTGWTAEMRIPFAILTPPGSSEGEFNVDSTTPLRVLVARYNYGRHLMGLELSSSPQLPRADYHLVEHYAPLRLLAAGEGE